MSSERDPALRRIYRRGPGGGEPGAAARAARARGQRGRAEARRRGARGRGRRTDARGHRARGHRGRGRAETPPPRTPSPKPGRDRRRARRRRRTGRGRDAAAERRKLSRRPRAPAPKPRPVPRPAPAAGAADPPPSRPSHRCRRRRTSPRADEAEAAGFGRVDPDGTVWVREAAGERVVGQYPGAERTTRSRSTSGVSPTSGRRCCSSRPGWAPGMPVKEIDSTLARLAAGLAEPAAVGDIDCLRARLESVRGWPPSGTPPRTPSGPPPRPSGVEARTAMVEAAEKIAATDPAQDRGGGPRANSFASSSTGGRTPAPRSAHRPAHRGRAVEAVQPRALDVRP